jgi:hypothetical protein
MLQVITRFVLGAGETPFGLFTVMTVIPVFHRGRAHALSSNFYLSSISGQKNVSKNNNVNSVNLTSWVTN